MFGSLPALTWMHYRIQYSECINSALAGSTLADWNVEETGIHLNTFIQWRLMADTGITLQLLEGS